MKKKTNERILGREGNIVRVEFFPNGRPTHDPGEKGYQFSVVEQIDMIDILPKVLCGNCVDNAVTHAYDLLGWICIRPGLDIDKATVLITESVLCSHG